MIMSLKAACVVLCIAKNICLNENESSFSSKRIPPNVLNPLYPQCTKTGSVTLLCKKRLTSCITCLQSVYVKSGLGCFSGVILLLFVKKESMGGSESHL